MPSALFRDVVELVVGQVELVFNLRIVEAKTLSGSDVRRY